MLIANATDAVTVALNNGKGSFNFSHQVPASQPVSLSVGDLDGDGDLDFVAAVDYRTPTVSMFFNQGNATFTEGPAVRPGFVTGSTALGDVDGDGDLDLLAASRSYDGRVAVFRNSGSGTFTAGPSFAVGYYPRTITLGDLDNDGDLDCAVVNQGSVTNGIYYSGSLCFNDGTGAFSAVTDYFLLGADPYALALGDVDGDQDLDIVVVNNHYATYSYGTMGVCLNNGSGKFSSRQTIALPSTPSSVALGDVDGDQDLDFVVTIGGWASGAGTFYERTARVGLNNGTGTFTLGQTVDASTVPSAVALADLDGDRDLDMAIANLMGNSYSVSLNQSASALPTLAGQVAVGFALAPNPARDRAELVGAPAHATIELLDSCGRLVARATADAAGTARLTWPAGLAGGVYIVRAGWQSRRLLIAE